MAPEHRRIEAPAKIFDSQDELLEAFRAGRLEGDFVAVIRGQGPKANGMPELHKLTPTLQVLQDRGQRVALLTDGRMSGASGTVLAAIHVVPEAVAGGVIGQLAEGDRVTVDAEAGTLCATWSTMPSAAPARCFHETGHADGFDSMTDSNAERVLVADIGGTNARFALAELNVPSRPLIHRWLAAPSFAT